MDATSWPPDVHKHLNHKSPTLRSGLRTPRLNPANRKPGTGSVRDWITLNPVMHLQIKDNRVGKRVKVRRLLSGRGK